MEHYFEIWQLGQSLVDAALKTIEEYYPGDLLIVNPTSFSRSDLVFTQKLIPEGTDFEKEDGSHVETQFVKDGSLLDVGAVPPYSISPLWVKNSKKVVDTNSNNQSNLIAQENLLENDYLRIEFNELGDINSIYCKELDQEILPLDAVANQFQAFEDRPKTPDAWEIDISYDEKMWLAEPGSSINIIEKGPLRAALEIKRTILNSTITQRISIDYNSRRLVFDTEVDWWEKFVLLKVAFPVQVLSPTATYEIQWGDIQRPTHRNTSWDWAKFEVPAHKWVDLSEGGYGVSLLNDCKYGHDIHENVIRLTLLRSPSYPDPSADQGQHQFIYSLFPHGSDWKTETIQAAYELNYPLMSHRSSDREEDHRKSTLVEEALIRVNQPNVIVETIKQAEDENGIIVRLFESQRKRCEFDMMAGFNLSRGWRVNILEEEMEELSISKNTLTYNIAPYQILTFRLIPA
jgi:alpha-mannosidase